MSLSRMAASALAVFASQAVCAVDLVETYQAAQLQDQTFAAAKSAQMAGREKLTQGRAAILPTLNLSASSTYTVNETKISTLTRQLNYNGSGYSLSLVQPLFRQQNWQLYAESDLQVLISDAQFKLAQQDLILRVSQAYFDVLMAQDSVRLAVAQKRAISEQLEQAKRSFEVGTATITDTYEAQARFDQTYALEIVANSTLEVKQRALQQMTNIEVTQLNPLGKKFSLDTPQPADVEKWVEQAQRNSLMVSVASLAAELADKEVSRNFGGHLPTLDLVASYAKNSTNGGTFTGTGFGAVDEIGRAHV